MEKIEENMMMATPAGMAAITLATVFNFSTYKENRSESAT
jgi:hypothetical protein